MTITPGDSEGMAKGQVVDVMAIDEQGLFGELD